MDKEQEYLADTLRYYGMPEENIETCINQIAQGYGASRYLDGVANGAEAVDVTQFCQEIPEDMARVVADHFDEML